MTPDETTRIERVCIDSLLLLLLSLPLLTSCNRRSMPLYCYVPVPRVIVEVIEAPDLKFSYSVSPEEYSRIYQETDSNGWQIIRNLPPLENYDDLSNWWANLKIESHYTSNAIYYRQKL